MSEQHQSAFRVEPDLDVSKKDYYQEQLQGVTPDAIFVLGGGTRAIKPHAKDNGEMPQRTRRFTTSPIKGIFWKGIPEKRDETGAIVQREKRPTYGGAKLRPIAAAELVASFPKAEVITFSHRPENLLLMSARASAPTDEPSYAAVIASDMKRYGVGKDIEEVPQTTSTFTEIIEALIISSENNWQNTAVVTNDYHLERGRKLLGVLLDDSKRTLIRNRLQFLFTTGEETEKFDKKWDQLERAIAKFREMDAAMVFVSAENIAMKRNKHYETLIRSLEGSSQYKNMIEQEREGNNKIDDGSYRFDQPTFREYILAS